MKRCVIIGAVEVDYPMENMIQDNDFVICAGKGWQNAIQHGIKPDMIVGDFDSSPMPENIDANIEVLPVVKDDTDTYHIARYVVEQGYTDVLMCGLLGGKRMEHTIANLQTLVYLAKNRVNATMIDKYSQVIAIVDGKITLPDMPGKFFSLFTMGEKSQGVCIRGAFYNLEDAILTNDYPIGISNEFVGTPVEIEVKDGSLLLIISNKD